MKAKIAFTYGWTDEQIMSMPYNTLLEYWRCITPIEAQKALLDMNIACYPKMTDVKRKQFFADIKGKAYNMIQKASGVTMSPKEMAMKLAGRYKNG